MIIRLVFEQKENPITLMPIDKVIQNLQRFSIRFSRNTIAYYHSKN